MGNNVFKQIDKQEEAVDELDFSSWLTLQDLLNIWDIEDQKTDEKIFLPFTFLTALILISNAKSCQELQHEKVGFAYLFYFTSTLTGTNFYIDKYH